MPLPLSGLNFRDLGGLPAVGGRVREGILFRSEGPRNFSQEQFAAIRSIGFKAIIDLRSAGEREELPHEWCDAECHRHALDVNADVRVFGNEGRERLSRGPELSIAVDTMSDTYREIVHSLIPHWPVIGEVLLDDRLPVLVNCTAGKDRTGVSIALLLELAGVQRDVILQDYLQSVIFADRLMQSGWLEQGLRDTYGFLPSPDQVAALIGVRPEYLEAAWAEVAQQWRDVPSYFAQAGVDAVMQERIRSTLVG